MAHPHQAVPSLNPDQARLGIAVIRRLQQQGALPPAIAQGIEQGLLDAALPRQPGQATAQRVRQLRRERRQRIEDGARGVGAVLARVVQRGSQHLQAIDDDAFATLIDEANPEETDDGQT